MNRWTASLCLGVAAFCASVAAQQPSAGGQDANKPATVSNPAQDSVKPEKPAAPSLDDLLAQALKNNPDIRVVEAKVREVEAEANRVRLLVTQKVAATQHAIEVQKGAAGQAQRRFETQKKMLGGTGGGATSREEYIDAQQKLSEAKAKLSDLEAELAFLTGKQPQYKVSSVAQPNVDFVWRNFDRVTTFQPHLDFARLQPDVFARQQLTWPPVNLPAAPATPGSAADKLRKALETQVEVKFDHIPLHDVLNFLENSASGISFRVLDHNDNEREVNLKLNGQVSIGAVLQALEDSFTEGANGLRFVVRDYGILVTKADRVPPGAVHVESLWRAGRASAEKSAETEKTKKEKPASDKPQ